MNRCVIVGGAEIKDYAAINNYLCDDDFYIFCDSGLFHMEKLGVSPSLIVGDFDSHPAPTLSVETITLPRAKDDTDTFFAAKEALSRGFSDFLLIGAVGGRLDHSLGNISILHMLHTNGCSCKLIDDYSEMEIVDINPKYVDDSFPYFSIINSDGSARQITIRNALFPIENAEISPDFQCGISNEPIKGKIAEITVAHGRALLMRIR